MPLGSKILILEDNDERLEAFHSAVRSLGGSWEIKYWVDAASMIAECGDHLGSAGLVSLDHDLLPRGEQMADPGNGLQVATHLARVSPCCPIIIHTSNHVRRLVMHQELLSAGWKSELVIPSGPGWIGTDWVRRARALLGARARNAPG